MDESFGLDRRIDNLTGKRKVGFYYWDLECLEMVVGDLKGDQIIDKTLTFELYNKIKQAMDYIENYRGELKK